MPSMLETVKRAAVEAVNASSPMSITTGEVTSVDPLKIKLEQKITLEEKYLALTSTVSDYEVEVTLDHATEETTLGSQSHLHAVKGKKTITIHQGLKVGESVLLLVKQGGQKYIVLDRVRQVKK